MEVKPGADLVKVCQYPMPLEVTHQESTELGCPQTWAVSQEHTLAAHQEASYQMITDQSRTCKMSTQHRAQPLHPTQLDVPGPAMVYYPGTKRYIFFFHSAFGPTSPSNGMIQRSGSVASWHGTDYDNDSKNPTTIFHEALHEDLGVYRTQNPDIHLLQYVDDLLTDCNCRPRDLSDWD